ncbi:uncharacterized protein LOC128263265 isoform X1 [Drosophila gunungcola]|uniref:Ataxin-2 C-terminal domain-containing protein n=1 Tax=Drosophila gunungcola TaxID=103775 RepID=A0A9P9YSD8_9MUSC|nr:uncharacterized protein LOC128263265 isoform X1 [Drosophila gunungcola]KAI8042030.1 hypothetical protein M5D96_003330 [Drosophila gunungcola]
MAQFFAFPGRGMGLGMVQMQYQIPSPCAPVQYSLNPNAVEFVPSYRQRSEFPSFETKTEATSTTTLLRPEIVGDALVENVENGFHLKRQIFELLSQLGDEQMPLEEITVALLPGGHGLSMTFNTKRSNQQMQPLDPNISIFHGRQSLKLTVGDQEKLANRPESVLVAQFLCRVNDVLSEKYEYGGDASVCPKCTLCCRRSYTELEIEHQIEGIKAFEKFFNFTESTRYQDLVSHEAFKDLCHKLGLIVSRDQIHINRACSGGVTTVVPPPPPSTQSSSATVCNSRSIDGMETDVEAEAYAGDDESQPIGGKHISRGSAGNSIPKECVRGKLYRYDNSEGSQLVNQLNEADHETEPMMVDVDIALNIPKTAPAKTVMATSVSATFPRVYKSAKAKCSARGAGPSGKPSGSHVHRSSAGQATCSTMPPLRATMGGGQFQSGSTGTAIRKLPVESCTSGAARKPNRLSTAKSGCVYQQSGNMPPVVAGPVIKPGKPGTSVQKQQLNHVCKSVKGAVAGRNGMTNSKQTHGSSQRMIPRSTQASLMRQSEVKRRMSLMRGESDSDLLFNEYLFK